MVDIFGCQVMWFRRFLIRALLALLLAGAPILASAAHAVDLVMATPEGEGIFTDFLKDLYALLGQRSGHSFLIKELPKQRALILAKRGEVDGLAARLRRTLEE